MGDSHLIPVRFHGFEADREVLMGGGDNRRLYFETFLIKDGYHLRYVRVEELSCRKPDQQAHTSDDHHSDSVKHLDGPLDHHPLQIRHRFTFSLPGCVLAA